MLNFGRKVAKETTVPSTVHSLLNATPSVLPSLNRTAQVHRLYDGGNNAPFTIIKMHRETYRQKSENRTLRAGDCQNSFLTGLQVINAFVNKLA